MFSRWSENDINIANFRPKIVHYGTEIQLNHTKLELKSNKLDKPMAKNISDMLKLKHS